ncbi:MAG: LysM peptidoglycan-binding protein [Thermoleophilia bacterium]|nr:LysM peptidoglycan-binding protein [Thermoleophilia bacterium]
MCGTGTVGSGAAMPMASMAHNTSVAGASGGGDVAGAAGGGDMSSIASLLAEISKSIQALQQALAGSGALANAAGGGGHGDMAGCDMMGGGAGGESGAVNGANDGAETIGDTVEGGGGHGHAPAKSVDQTDVAGDTGAGKDAPGKDSDVAGDTGAGKDAPGKDSGVAGTGGGGNDPTQKSVEKTANEQAQAALVAADKKSVDAAAAVKAAGEKVTSAKSGVDKAKADLTTAEKGKKTADTALVDAAAALTAAKTGHGEHVADGSITIEQVAKKHGVTVAKLKELNPTITILGSLPAGTKVKLPKGVGVAGKVAEAQTKLDAARTAANTAAKAVTDAIAALNAAREALRQAEAAEAAAKKAAEDAKKAADEAKKAAEAAAAAEKKAAADAKAAEDKKAAEATKAAEGGGGIGGEAPPKPKTYTVAAGDTLASIARRAGIGDWHKLYDLNKAVIGNNPNQIKPGMVLTLPANATDVAQRTSTNSGSGTSRSSVDPVGSTRDPIVYKPAGTVLDTRTEQITRSINRDRSTAGDPGAVQPGVQTIQVTIRTVADGKGGTTEQREEKVLSTKWFAGRF